MTTPSPLVLVTQDPVVHAEVSRLSAAAAVALEVVGPAGVAEHWRTAAALVVGADVAERVAHRAPGRREDVWVVGAAPLGEGTLRSALALRCAGVAELPAEAGRLGTWLADLGDRGTDEGRVLGVLGASGGVGASVLALALAEVAAFSGPALLVDLDPWGLPAGVLAGVVPDAGSEAVTWTDLTELEGRVGARALRESLPARDDLRVLGWSSGAAPPGGPSERVVREVLNAARGGHAWVVVDVPRSPATRELLTSCDAVVVVASPTLAGTAGAARVAGLVPPGVPAGVVVRAGRGTLPDELAALTGLPLWGRLKPQRGLDEHLAAGLGAVRSSRSPCARAAGDVLAAAAGAVPRGSPPLRPDWDVTSPGERSGWR